MGRAWDICVVAVVVEFSLTDTETESFRGFECSLLTAKKGAKSDRGVAVGFSVRDPCERT